MKPERSFARRIDLTSLQLFVAVCELGRHWPRRRARIHRRLGGEQAPVRSRSRRRYRPARTATAGA